MKDCGEVLWYEFLASIRSWNTGESWYAGGFILNVSIRGQEEQSES